MAKGGQVALLELPLVWPVPGVGTEHETGPVRVPRPDDLEEVLATLAELGDEAKVLAGGQSLVPMLNLRLARFGHLVDIGRVAELRGIERDNGSLVVEAGTRDAVVEFDPTVAADVPLLAAVTPYIGHFQIRNRGTIGGSLAHADPAAEYPAVAVALDATFDARLGARRQVGAGRRRSSPASGRPRSRTDELLRSIAFPVWSGRCGFGVAEFARRHGDFAIAGAVAAVELDDRDVVARCAIAVFGVGGTPIRATAAEAAVAGSAGADVDPARRRSRRRSTPSTTSPTTPRCRPPTAGRSPSRWSPTPGGAPSTTLDDEERPDGPRRRVAMTVNGAPRRVTVEPRKTLADVLREDLGLTGTHLGCEHGVCGACTVLVDGDAVRSCLMFAVQAEGADVVTVEGLAPAGRSSSATSSRRCTTATGCSAASARRGSSSRSPPCSTATPTPTTRRSATALSGNLCRCTGYQGIVKAVQMAAGARSAS